MATRTRLTKLEAEALFSAAGNMKDDFEDYYSFMGKKLKKFSEAYSTGMDKLSSIAHRQQKKKVNTSNRV